MRVSALRKRLAVYDRLSFVFVCVCCILTVLGSLVSYVLIKAGVIGPVASTFNLAGIVLSFILSCVFEFLNNKVSVRLDEELLLQNMEYFLRYNGLNEREADEVLAEMDELRRGMNEPVIARRNDEIRLRGEK
jgi:hypothetical protein